MSVDELDRAQAVLHKLVTRHPQVLLGDLEREGEQGRRLGQWFATEGNPALVQRLALYSQGGHHRIVEALADVFPATSTALGTEAFAQCVWRYLRRFPSCQPDLRWVGRHFAEFLALPPEQRRFDWQNKPWLVDVARVEWAQSLAFDADDSSPLQFVDVQRLAPEQWLASELIWQPSVQRVNTRYCLEAYVNEPVAEHEPAKQQPCHYVVWRRGVDVQLQVLRPKEARLLDCARGGIRIQEFCVQIARCFGLTNSATAELAVSLLRRWTQWQCLRLWP